MTGPILTLDLLERLREEWSRQQAPVVENLRPGLPPKRIETMTAALGLHLPEEARTWWGWHDGVDVELGPAGELGPGLPFLPLRNAVDLCRLFRDQAAQAWGDQAEVWWRPSWFPITERLGAIRCDCRLENGTSSPIFYADSHDYDSKGLMTPRVGSFGTMVTWWVEALESGAWRYSPETKRWEHHAEVLNAERRGSGLV